ncbi:MAG: DUF89 family protein [Candidatus Aminicenantes bacterium]|nr:DUF89 family protein [Candidatus Aminicenantes bacterium]
MADHSIPATRGAMATSLDCLPCFVRQALAAARMATPDPGVQETIVREVLKLIDRTDLSLTPAFLAQRFHRRIRDIVGSRDPYREAKDRQNALALSFVRDLRAEIESSADPLLTAARLAVAGNVIDLGAPGDVSRNRVRTAVEQALSEPLRNEGDGLREALVSARKILYLADNAGEIAFDRLFVEQLGPNRVTVAVRGGPVINDATIEDARAVGLDEIVEVIDNGSDAPGTLLDDCGPEFQRRFAEADLILAKGQGNYETLGRHPSDIIFLFAVKCPVIAGLSGAPVGSHVWLRPLGEEAHSEARP